MTKYTTNHTSTQKKMSNKKKRERNKASKQADSDYRVYKRQKHTVCKKGHVVGKMEGNHLFS